MPRPDPELLRAADYDFMASILDRFKNERAMNLEELDGFFTALICSPEMTLPSQYMPEIWGGGEMLNSGSYDGMEQVQQFMTLVTTHWNKDAYL